MEFYLIRHGHVDYCRAVDRYAVGLSAEGREQSDRVAALCERWGIEFIAASTLVRAEQTADVIQARLPEALRWDLDELQNVDVQEAALSPTLNPRPSEWSDDQRRLAYERTWVRLTGALIRLQVYARSYNLRRIAIVTHYTTANLLLLLWLGLDWHAVETLHFDLGWCATCKIVVDGDRTGIAWVNRPS